MISKFAGLLLTVLTAALAFAADDKVHIEGLLVVTDCPGAEYQKLGMKVDNAVIERAAACAKSGVPVALLVGTQPNGELYTLVSPSPLIAPHIAKRARLSGEEIAPHVIIPDKLEIETDTGWQEIRTTTMM